MEFDFLETFERMKTHLEQMPGFSTKKLFTILDVKKFNFLDIQ